MYCNLICQFSSFSVSTGPKPVILWECHRPSLIPWSGKREDEIPERQIVLRLKQ